MKGCSPCLLPGGHKDSVQCGEQVTLQETTAMFNFQSISKSIKITFGLFRNLAHTKVWNFKIYQILALKSLLEL